MDNESINVIKKRVENVAIGEMYVSTALAVGGAYDIRYKDSKTRTRKVDKLFAVVGTLEGAEFVAHACEDIPQLVAEVERLQRGREISTEQIRQLFGEIARLKEALMTVRDLSDDSDMVEFIVNEALKEEEESE